MATADKTEWTAEAIVGAAVQRLFMDWGESRSEEPFVAWLTRGGAETVRQVAKAAQAPSNVLDEALKGIESVAQVEGTLDPKDQTIRALQYENKQLREMFDRVCDVLGVQ